MRIGTGSTSVGHFAVLVGLALSLVLSVSAQQSDQLNIDVYVPPASNTATLTSNDFDVLLDGQVAEVISAERSSQPLEIVLLFITNWSGCVDSLAPFAAIDQIKSVFGDQDQVAIVVSDGSGTVIRELSKPGISLSSDLTKAIKMASRNFYEDMNLDTGTYDSKPGLTFPMKGLQASLGLFSKSSGTGKKVIVFVNDLQNTREGTQDEAISGFSRLVEEEVSVSWLTTRNFKSRFSITRIPYGRRDFFFTLPSASGGIVRECREAKDSAPVVWGRSRTEYYSFENDLKEILDTHRNRYTLRFRKGESQPRTLRSVSISLKKEAHLNSQLAYPRAVKY